MPAAPPGQMGAQAVPPGQMQAAPPTGGGMGAPPPMGGMQPQMQMMAQQPQMPQMTPPQMAQQQMAQQQMAQQPSYLAPPQMAQPQQQAPPPQQQAAPAPAAGAKAPWLPPPGSLQQQMAGDAYTKSHQVPSSQLSARLSASGQTDYKRVGDMFAIVDTAKVQSLLAERTNQKIVKNFHAADEIRAQLTAMGVRVDDRERSWKVDPLLQRPMLPSGPVGAPGGAQQPAAGGAGAGAAPWELPPTPTAPPPDAEYATTIKQLAAYVHKNGASFETMMREKQAQNPKFTFLFGGAGFEYYRWCKHAAAQNWTDEQVAEQLAAHLGPAAATAAAATAALSAEEVAEFVKLLEELTGSKDSIKGGMKWVIDHAQQGRQVAGMMVRTHLRSRHSTRLALLWNRLSSRGSSVAASVHSACARRRCDGEL